MRSCDRGLRLKTGSGTLSADPKRGDDRTGV
jgi:hypothetical protein